MNELGSYTLCLGWLLVLASLTAGAYFNWRGDLKGGPWMKCLSALILACLIVSTLTLAALFLRDDYANRYVWQYSNRAMPALYKLAAVWGGMDGSLLLWALMLALWGAGLEWMAKPAEARLSGWAVVVLNSSLFFFLSVVLFAANPFRYVAGPLIPADGNGLNPLLQNPFMVVHPPALYGGFTLQVVPYAFGMAALISGDLSPRWWSSTRRWVLMGWMILSAGIVLGGVWAYLVLGWGGFWAWDPVENASLLPWLCSTALLHSALAGERRGVLGGWNLLLGLLTYTLTIFGTFLTRSGVVQSVHAFGPSPIGWVFLGYLLLIMAAALFLGALRWKKLLSRAESGSGLWQEGILAIGSFLLIAICLAVIWGLLYPLLSRVFDGRQQEVGAGYFNAVSGPLFLGLIFLMALGLALPRGAFKFGSVVLRLWLPILAAAFVMLVFYWSGLSGKMPALTFSVCAFAALVLMGSLRLGELRKSGVVLAHLGLIIMAVAITAAISFKLEKDFALSKGQTIQVGRYNLTLEALLFERLANYQSAKAWLRVQERSSERRLVPELRSYYRPPETTSEVALHVGWLEDLYVVLAGLDESETTATFKVFINPLQVWLWIGAGLMLIGAGTVFCAGRRQVEG